MGDMTEPAAKVPTTIDPCPACHRGVTDIYGKTPLNPDIEPLGKQVIAAPTGFMEWLTVPCGHPVEYAIRPDGHVTLSPRQPA